MINVGIFSKASLLSILTISFFAFSSFAQVASMDDDFYRVTSTETEVVPVSPSEYQQIAKLMNGNMHISCQDDNSGSVFNTNSSSPLAPLKESVSDAKDIAKDVTAIVDEGNKIVDGLINIGSKIWTIVKAGKPVVNLNIGPSANALPRGVTCWDELENWQIPNVTRVKTKLNNVYGYSLAEFQFDVIFTYGGSFNGAGKYLTHVQVFPSDVYAFWMQEFNASVEVASIINRGSKTNPIAGMQVDVLWQLTNFLNEVQQSASVFVDGTGASKVINL